MKNTTEVQKIIEYLQEKIASLKLKAKDFEGPIAQDVLRTSPHMQFEYLRLKTAIETNEDNLLAIQKFAGSDTVISGDAKPAKVIIVKKSKKKNAE